MGYLSVSYFQSFDDDDDTDLTQMILLLSLVALQLIFVDRLGFLSDHLISSSMRLYLVLLFHEFLFVST